uniref:Uncharacterized protein n=1 Tax=Romanomermis culicivorax TaxID=13658 RepID=A0A915L1F8_ROMCU
MVENQEQHLADVKIQYTVKFEIRQAGLNTNRSGWRYSFLLCASIQVAGVLIYLLWSSGRVQKWATNTTTTTGTSEMKNDRQVSQSTESTEKF